MPQALSWSQQQLVLQLVDRGKVLAAIACDLDKNGCIAGRGTECLFDAVGCSIPFRAEDEEVSGASHCDTAWQLQLDPIRRSARISRPWQQRLRAVVAAKLSKSLPVRSRRRTLI